MMEYVGLTLVFMIGNMLAGAIMTVVTFKLMTNKKFMKKWCKKYMQIVKDLNDDLIDEWFDKGTQ